MKNKNTLLLLFLFFVLISCDKSNDPIANESELIIGNWINPVIVDSLSKFERSNSLKKDDYGFSFKSEQLFIERKNAGWCATPPIHYENFEGTWTKNDSVINIAVNYWGGFAVYQWKIISIDRKYLTIYRLKEECNFIE